MEVNMNIFSRLPKKLIAGVAIIAAIAGITSAAVAGFGPDRPTKTYEGPGTAGFDYPVFNSFVNVPEYGDERNFLTGKYPGGTFLTDPLAQVKQDEELTLQVLVHNNADPKYNADGSGFAKDTTVRIALPTGMAKNQVATAYIDASNTNPKQVTDTLDFGAFNGGFFELDYVEGSAKVYGNYINTTLSDDIVTNGVTIGTRSLNGTVEGCFDQEILVTIKVKVKMPHYTLKKEVRLESESTTSYADTKNASLSDTLVWKMTFTNIGLTKLEDVKFIDPIPENMSIIPGTIKVYNASNPSGYTVPDSAIQMNGRQIEMILGDYAASGNAFVYFKTKTDRNTADICGTVAQTNTAYVQPSGLIAISDSATVSVNTGKECDSTKPSYSCTALVTKLGGREIKVTTNVVTSPAGAVNVKNYEYNFGDGSSKFLTDKNVVNHKYAKDGTYNISVVVTFSVNGVDKTAICNTNVTFASTPPVLPDTGAGSLYGLFAGISVVGATLHRLWTVRRVR
jgi:uncharacterized repeat protein (TIGR01451 family)